MRADHRTRRECLDARQGRKGTSAAVRRLCVPLDASGEAQLPVIGGRPHTPAAALVADSVGQRLLYHAACPLLITHTEPHDRPLGSA